MHIEPGVVNGAKLWLGFITAIGSFGLTLRFIWEGLKQQFAIFSLLGKAVIASLLVLCFFQILPSRPVGVSEVHFILGSTLFLLLGAAPAAIGLAVGLLAQGIFFVPTDLPQYGMNVTSLLVPLFAMVTLSQWVIPKATAYQDISYSQALTLSLTYQAGVVSWVAFWAFYGQGFTASNIAAVTSFASAYLIVILLEPMIDLACLAGAKHTHSLPLSQVLNPRIFKTA